MKGHISIKDFIAQVKQELMASVDEETPFFELGPVELEIAFALDASASAGAKLFVVDIGGSTKATQTHKVRMRLTPFLPAGPEAPRPPGKRRVAVTKTRGNAFRQPAQAKKRPMVATKRAPTLKK